MKTMTCKQLYGPCDEPIRGESSQEMMENSKKHAMDMVAKGDKVHIEAMEAMKEQHANMEPEAVKQWMEKFQNEFDAQPEDK
jgi:glycerol-3-phosphate cytidylyltransferase-like family protein